MVQQGLWLDLPSGPGCSLKYLPCSHFNPHFNTSSILGHYSESVCPARLSLRLVCVCVWVEMVVKVTQPGWIPLYPGVTLASESCLACSRSDLSKNIAAVAITLTSFYFCPVQVHYSWLFHQCSISIIQQSHPPHSNPTEREGWSFVSVNDTDASHSPYRLIPPLFWVKGGGEAVVHVREWYRDSFFPPFSSSFIPSFSLSLSLSPVHLSIHTPLPPPLLPSRRQRAPKMAALVPGGPQAALPSPIITGAMLGCLPHLHNAILTLSLPPSITGGVSPAACSVAPSPPDCVLCLSAQAQKIDSPLSLGLMFSR